MVWVLTSPDPADHCPFRASDTTAEHDRIHQCIIDYDVFMKGGMVVTSRAEDTDNRIEAFTEESIKDATRKQLYHFCKQEGFTGVSGYNKAQLLVVVKNHLGIALDEEDKAVAASLENGVQNDEADPQRRVRQKRNHGTMLISSDGHG